MKRRKGWLSMARPKQLFPEDETWWNIGLIMAGRGFGKTRPFAEDAWWHCHKLPGFIYHVVARTDDDLRITCFEGESGVRAVCPPEVLKGGTWDKAYNASLQQITFANGSTILGFAAKSPGQMRGPQCHRAWGDEIAAWEENGPGKTQEALDNLLLGCRLPRSDGIPSRALFSTTPRPINALRALIKRDDIIVRTGSLYENINNLSDNFKKTILPMEGTRIGDQEIHGKMLDLEELGIIKRSWFPLYPAHLRRCMDRECPGCNPLPRFEYVLNSYDTALEEAARDKKKNMPDFTACQTYGVFRPALNAKPRALILDAWEDRLGFPDLTKRVKDDIRTKWGPKLYQRIPDMTLVERKGSGISLLQTLQRDVPKASIQSFNPGNMSKLARLHMGSPLVKQGQVWLLESPKMRGQPMSWYGTMLNQMCSFTGEGSIDFDDHVDAGTQAWHVLRDMGFIETTVEDPIPAMLGMQDRLVEPGTEEPNQGLRSNPYA